MTTAYSWHEAYRTALLETEWTKMLQRLQAAKSAIYERHRVLSEDHGSTTEERQAIASALYGLKVLRGEAAEGRNRQVPGRANAWTD